MQPIFQVVSVVGVCQCDVSLCFILWNVLTVCLCVCYFVKY